MSGFNLIILAGVAIAGASSTHADVVTTTKSSANTGFSSTPSALQLSKTDLINNGTPTFSNAIVGTTFAPFPATGLNDGISTQDAPGGNTFFQAPGDFKGVPSTTSATFNLNVGVNKSGYDITSIQTFMGWVGPSSKVQANQTYTVAVRLVGSETYKDIAMVFYLPFTDEDGTHMESHVILTENTTGILASGVESIRFTFLNPMSSVANGAGMIEGTVIRELDVHGVATVPKP